MANRKQNTIKNVKYKAIDNKRKEKDEVKHDINEKYYVVKNHEEQYSIYPDYKDIPAGWTVVKDPLPKMDCLRYIDEIWTDMRPLSLRIQMAEFDKLDGKKKRGAEKPGGILVTQ